MTNSDDQSDKRMSMETFLSEYQTAVDEALSEMKEQEIVQRIWAHDFTLWSTEPEEISNRLGWLHLPETMQVEVGRIQALKESLEADGFTDVLLLGMGGSSLAPEVFGHVFGPDHRGLGLSILDSTDPDAVEAAAQRINPQHTLFIVSTKSGGTVETLSFFKYFYNLTSRHLGEKKSGAHFIAITDEGSTLHKLAQHYRFREIFLNDPNIGGRYSALSHFGLVPAGLVGVDLEKLLDRALAAIPNLKSSSQPIGYGNQGALLGAILAELAKTGRDKLTILTSPTLANFGDWVEQLIAESTGKDGKGILPVVDETVGEPGDYGPDRVFVSLQLPGDDSTGRFLKTLSRDGHPLVIIRLKDKYDLGSQFVLWEMATAVAGCRLGIQPFNQPNVEAAKILAREMVQAYQRDGRLPAGEMVPASAAALDAFLELANPGDYLALQAYLKPKPETTVALQSLRLKLRGRTKLATTLGYGPRFLHSTGQLHKGDRGNGLFIQFVSWNKEDIPIPDEAGKSGSSIGFGVLKSAQALGDARALLYAGRRLIRFEVVDDDAAAAAIIGLSS